MSEHEKSSIRDCLFSGQDMKLRNIRFARGSDEVIFDADFRTQICRAAEQRRDGTAKLIGWPKIARGKIDARDFVANI